MPTSNIRSVVGCRPTHYAWEPPDELRCLMDDAVFDGFLGDYATTFSEEQRTASLGLRDALNHYRQATPQHLDAAETLADPRWDGVRQKAVAFINAFANKVAFA